MKMLSWRGVVSRVSVTLGAATLWLAAGAGVAAQENKREFKPFDELPCNALCRAWMGRSGPAEAGVAPVPGPPIVERSPREEASAERRQPPRRPVASRRATRLAAMPPVRTNLGPAAPRPQTVRNDPSARQRLDVAAEPAGVRATAPDRPTVAPSVPSAAAAPPTPSVLPGQASGDGEPNAASRPAEASVPPIDPPPDDEMWRTAGVPAAPVREPPGAGTGNSIALPTDDERAASVEPARADVQALVGPEIAGLADLEGRPVAAVATSGSAGENSARSLFLASGLGLQPLIVDVPSGTQAVALLRAGEVDAVLVADSDLRELSGVPLEGLRLVPVPLATRRE